MNTENNDITPFNEKETPKGMTFRNDLNGTIVKVLGPDIRPPIVLLLLTVGAIGFSIFKIEDLDLKIIFSLLVTIINLLIWRSKYMFPLIKISIFKKDIEFSFKNPELKSLKFQFDQIRLAKIKNEIIRGNEYEFAGKQRFKRHTLKLRSLVVELNDANEHYIPLDKESHRRYLMNVINKYKMLD